MKHRSSHRLMKFSTALLCLTILMAPFAAKPLLARNDKVRPKPTLAFSSGIDSNHRSQADVQAVSTQPNSSINIYIFLPVIAALPVQTPAESTNTVLPASISANTTQSLNIYIFLPAIAK